MSFNGIASFVVNYSDSVKVGLATQNLNCEWSDDRYTTGGAGYSDSFTLTQAGGEHTLDLSALTTSTSAGVITYAFRVTGGTDAGITSISSASFTAMLKKGGALCVASASPGIAKTEMISVTTTSSTAVTVEVIALLSPAG